MNASNCSGRTSRNVKKEIDELERNETIERLTSEQVGDIINVIHNTLRGVPIDLRELALAERDNGDALRRRMQSGTNECGRHPYRLS